MRDSELVILMFLSIEQRRSQICIQYHNLLNCPKVNGEAGQASYALWTTKSVTELTYISQNL